MHNKRSRDILSILANPVVLIKKRVRSRMLEPYKDYVQSCMAKGVHE